MLGVLMMIPLRRALIVKEHGNLPYPEGTACASVLIAGEKGGELARTAYQGLGFAFLYALFQKILGVIAETPAWVSNVKSRVFPAATVAADITPEYMGVGYIIGPRIAGVLVAGGVLAWLGVIPLLASLVPPSAIALQLLKLGYLADVDQAGRLRVGPGRADVRQFEPRHLLRLRAPDRRRRGGRGRLHHADPHHPHHRLGLPRKPRLAARQGGGVATRRTERDLPITVVLVRQPRARLHHGGAARSSPAACSASSRSA